jgi:hypothetical protein
MQHKKSDLLIANKQADILTKKQKEFNKLVKKIDEKRKYLDKFSRELDDCLDFYSKEVFPLEQQFLQLRITCLKLVFPFFSNKKTLPKRDIKVLGEILTGWLGDIMALNRSEPDEEMIKIIEAVSGDNYHEMKREQFMEMKEDMEEMFSDMGLDIDLSDMDENMSEEEVVRRMKVLQDEMKQRMEEKEAKKANRPKTKKQLEKEAKEKQVEEARSKSIGTIYKQLAKTFHPDLEKDETLRLQKEELMKQLTVAYESKDLHTLLRLELQWVQQEEDNLAKLTDDKLSIYNTLLKEQLQELDEKIKVVAMHPRYAPMSRLAPDPTMLNSRVLIREAYNLKDLIGELKQDSAKLQSNTALAHVLKIVNYFKANAYRGDDDDLLRALADAFRS